MMLQPKILIVDDDALSRQILKTILGKTNTYLEAGNGSDGISLLDHNEDVCLVLLDLDMPIMDGYQFLKHYQNNYTRAIKPDIIMTSCTEEAVFRRNAQNDDIDVLNIKLYMQKPFNMALLKQCVAEAATKFSVNITN